MDKRRLIVLLSYISILNISFGATVNDSVVVTPIDTTSNVQRNISLENVVVYGSRNNFGVTSSQMSAVSLTQTKIQAVPVFLGEVLKSLQKFPGVQSTNDGTAGIFVRGGDYDQNYITLDGSALYNGEHLKGFVSAINPDIVQNINFYRGAFPARYGSRLSSVVDVGVKEGDYSSYHGLLSIGMLSSRLRVEGPIWKNRTSFNVAARVSHFNIIAKPLLKHFYDREDALQPYQNMTYYDLSAKVVHWFNRRNKLSVVAYYGRDKDENAPTRSSRDYSSLDDGISFFKNQSLQTENRSSSMTNNWWNFVASVYWTANFSDRFKLNTNLSYSKYSYQLGYNNYFDNNVTDHYREYYYHKENTTTTYKNDIGDLAIALDGEYKINFKHTLRAGFRLSNQELTPEYKIYKDSFTKRYNGSLNEESTIIPDPEYITHTDTINYTTNEGLSIKNAAIYAEDDFNAFDKLKINIGVRGSAYFVTRKSSFAVEPRLAVRYLANDNFAIKLSYSRMTQGIHRLMSGNLVMASDIWVPITSQIPLMTSNLYGIAFNYNLPLDITLVIEGYYKTMDNVLEYRNAASYMQSQNKWSDMVAVGKGRSYGVEFFLEKTMGDFNGWLSYTWAKSLRKFDRPGQEIDGGQEFYAASDRRHNFNAVVMRKFPLSDKTRIDVSVSWSFQSGRRGTIPYAYIFGNNIKEFEGLAQFGEQDVIDFFARGDREVYETYFGGVTDAPVPFYTYKSRNDFILPCIHHLDVSSSFVVAHKLGETSIGVSIYNIYNRKNVSNVFVGYEDKKIVLKGICPFPIMPSITVTQKF